MAKKKSDPPAVHADITVIGETALWTGASSSEVVLRGRPGHQRLLEWLVAAFECDEHRRRVGSTGSSVMREVTGDRIIEHFTQYELEYGDGSRDEHWQNANRYQQLLSTLRNGVEPKEAQFITRATSAAGYRIKAGSVLNPTAPGVAGGATVLIDVVQFAAALVRGDDGDFAEPIRALNLWHYDNDQVYASWPTDDHLGVVVPAEVEESRARLQGLRAELADYELPIADDPGARAGEGGLDSSVDDAVATAAWKILVQLETRVAGRPLQANDGILREALTSYHAFFGIVGRS